VDRLAGQLQDVDQVVVTFFAAPRSYTLKMCRNRVPWSPSCCASRSKRLANRARASPSRGVHAARVYQRPHRSSASRGGSRSDRLDDALSGSHRGAADGRLRITSAEAGEGATAAIDFATRSGNRLRGRRYRLRVVVSMEVLILPILDGLKALIKSFAYGKLVHEVYISHRRKAERRQKQPF